MQVPGTFIRAWRAWRHAARPYSNAYLQRQSTPTSEVEYVLTHMDSSLYGIGSAALEGKAWDYAGIASRELAELDEASTNLEGCDVPESEKEEFRAYMQVMRELWREVQNLVPGEAQANNSLHRTRGS